MQELIQSVDRSSKRVNIKCDKRGRFRMVFDKQSKRLQECSEQQSNAT